MAQLPKVAMVRVGKKRKSTLYVLSESGRVYQMKQSVVAEQCKNNRIGVEELCRRTMQRGTIDTKFYTKVKELTKANLRKALEG